MSVIDPSEALMVPDLLVTDLGRARLIAAASLGVKPVAWCGKRVFDLALALMALVLVLPLGLLIAAAIKLTSRGPVFFRQERVGFAGTTFPILKFRTMRADAEEVLYSEPDLFERYLASDHKIPLGDDPRVTRLGRLLRKASLDELPQLLNVLTGDMSLVGPRPVCRSQLDDYEGWEPVYLDMRPGITGLWQVSGRNRVHFPDRAALDAMYFHRCRLGTDLWILARTLPAVVLAEGAR